jgi:pimeloyl-ACP methyl ester carboxylesterase
MKFALTDIVTKDNLVHQGIYFDPAVKGTKAMLWVHGLTGRFYGDTKLMNLFAHHADKGGLGFAAFNNRGHDIVTNIRRINPSNPSEDERVMIGASGEVFAECVQDIEAAIAFLAARGYTQIILVGHSTGANKVCFYAATQNDNRVGGIVLAGPMSDRLSGRCTKETTQKLLAVAKHSIVKGRGDALENFPDFFPATAKRVISLLEPGSEEDIFTYGDTPPLERFSTIKIPMFIVLSERDETADRPIEDIRHVFDTHQSSKNYRSVVIPGANHGYEGKEEEFVSEVVHWVSSV